MLVQKQLAMAAASLMHIMTTTTQPHVAPRLCAAAAKKLGVTQPLTNSAVPSPRIPSSLSLSLLITH